VVADRFHRIWVDFARAGALAWPEFDREIMRLVAQGRRNRDIAGVVGLTEER
jgi:hypothetical protein